MPHTATILTVDDNDALRYSLTRTLRGEGYKVLEARTGAEALALADQFPDLITLDLNLPDFDGFEVCREQIHRPRTSPSCTFQPPSWSLSIEYAASKAARMRFLLNRSQEMSCWPRGGAASNEAGRARSPFASGGG